MSIATTVEEAMKDWRWLMPIDDIEIVDTDCLGGVIFRDANGSLMILEVVSAEVRSYPRADFDSLAGFNHLTEALESQGLILGPGQCYGLKPHAIFKDFVAKNVYVATLAEYVSFMGTFHRQIKDLPNGSTIRLRVAPEPVNHQQLRTNN